MEASESFQIFTQFNKSITKPIFDEKSIKKEEIGGVFNQDLNIKTMRENQRIIFNKYSNSHRLSISEPPGAGKSMTIMFTMAHRLLHQKNHKVIIIIPQTVAIKSFGKEILQFDDGTIFHWDIYNNLCESFPEIRKIQAIIDFLNKKEFTNNPNERILITTHQAMARTISTIVYDDLLFNNTTVIIDEAHHILYSEYGNKTNFITNQIGELIKNINGNQNCSIWLTTATPFRGDKNNIIPKEQMKEFDVHFLPLDKHWEDNIKYIKSFSFDFVIYKTGKVFDGVKEIIKNKKKTIIFCPFIGKLVKNSNKRLFRDELIKNIKEVWPECNIMDLIETVGRNLVKKQLFDNEKASNYDVILTLKMFDEATDWVCAEQCIDLSPSDTLRILYQRFGRLWRDYFGKHNINYYCFLPFEVNFSSDEKRREHLSNAYNVFVATLLLQETVDPIPHPKKRITENKIFNSPLDSITSDKNERENLIREVVNKLLTNIDQNSLPDSSKVHNWIEEVIDKYKIPKEYKEDVINHIAKILRRNIKSKETSNIEWMREAGFDKIWSNEIFDNLLVFGTKTCGINHFEDFRKIYKENKTIDEWVKFAEELAKNNNGVLPSMYRLQKDFKALSAAIYNHSEKFNYIIKTKTKNKTIDEWVKFAEELAKNNNGKLPPMSCLQKDFKALSSAIYKHPEKFNYTINKRKTLSEKFNYTINKRRTIDEWFQITKHIPRIQNKHRTLDEWFQLAKQIASCNNGILPGNKILEKIGFPGLRANIKKHPSHFETLRNKNATQI
jgi:superfamily II DNA or RNA helicase